MMKKAVFLDRDGVLNKTVVRMGKPRAPYSLDELQLFEGVKEAVGELKQAGYVLIVVTNQPDVVRGWVDLNIVEAVNQSIMKELKLDDLMVCYHIDKDDCHCRKPRPGMLQDAQLKWEIDMDQSFMVGDRHSDIEAGYRAGCRTILIGDGEEALGKYSPHYQASSLLLGARWILNKDQG